MKTNSNASKKAKNFSKKIGFCVVFILIKFSLLVISKYIAVLIRWAITKTKVIHEFMFGAKIKIN